MAGLKERLQADLVAAMKAGDTDRRTVLRGLTSAVKNAEIESVDALGEAGVTAVLQKQLKQRRESMAAYAERPELADRERTEAAIIETYLPAPLTDEELGVLVDQAVTQTGAASMAEMGTVMSVLTPQVAGRAEGGRVAALVKSRLA